MIHFTKRGKQEKYTPITSIDFMRQRAADSGEYAGSDDAVYTGRPGTESFAATVTVWRLVQGQKCSFTATARWSEYKPDAGVSGKGDVMWLKLGHVMLSKCAESLALRKAFPKQTAKLYEWAEMAQAGFSPAPQVSIRPPRAAPKNFTSPAPQVSIRPPQAAPKNFTSPPTPSAAPQEAPEPGSHDGDKPSDIGITEIKVKGGASTKGPWKCFFIHGDDGKTYTTFDEKVSEYAANAQSEGRRVLITAGQAKKGKRGDFHPIMGIS
jgi:hypothetical protein